ncbi:aromatic acid exporter family protein [Virgibacillus xinjiangensis]|uniref:Aromatic acid exporter family protein n=1 Tax=Virgibacillus xinjiangensis TaxID=393090 RepID=A0ABV7CZ21_9BACI
MKKFPFIGTRIIKTGVAIFFTALICDQLGWPPVFAVITAIVTIEPTVSDSIKKGIVRFPASAIGSAYAVLFISLLGDSPLTYTLAAVLTIATCVRLKLHAGLLVATLTAVAMVEVIHTNYLVSFFIRLGTTTVGLLISTIVNFFVLPPDYREDIANHIQSMSMRTGSVIEKVFGDILNGKMDQVTAERNLAAQVTNEIRRTETLIRFQKEEAKFHPLAGNEQTEFDHAQNQLLQLRMIHYHMNNIINTPLIIHKWSKEEKEIILHAVKELANVMQRGTHFDISKYEKEMNLLTELFWEDNEELTKNNKEHPTKFPPELIILYELLTIYELASEFYRGSPNKENPAQQVKKDSLS